MVREPKIDVVDLIRDKWSNPNSSMNTGGKGVFPDYPKLSLRFSSYPRVSVIDVSREEEVLGLGTKSKKVTWTGEVGIWVKEVTDKEQLIEINDEVYSEEKLVDYIRAQIFNVILQNKWDELGDDYLHYELMSDGEILYDLDRKAYFKPTTIMLRYIEHQIMEE